MSPDKLVLVREFWDETPCDAQSSYAERYRFRYGKDAWILNLLKRIADRYDDILEVGCGQGTDGITLCRLLSRGSRYVGADMSTVSLASAKAAAASVASELRVNPTFQEENAEHLSFSDSSFECVLSIGVLHHSSDTGRALAEVRRVLRPGGTAFVGLYRKASPKVIAANVLRAAQAAADHALSTDRIIYRLLRRTRMPALLGTALQECFGVPILRSYTKREMEQLFASFSSLRLTAHGIGLPPAPINVYLEPALSGFAGYLWLAEAVK